MSNPSPFMTYRDECDQLRAQVAALTEQRNTYCEKWHNELGKHDPNADTIRTNVRIGALTAALGKAREALTTVVERPRAYEATRMATLALAAIDALGEKGGA